MIHADHISCSRCKGTGKVKLEGYLQATLAWLRGNGPATADEARRALDPAISTSAFCNRLKDLLTLGFATRQKRGKEWVYTATERP